MDRRLPPAREAEYVLAGTVHPDDGSEPIALYVRRGDSTRFWALAENGRPLNVRTADRLRFVTEDPR
jgi:hypothetical protein